MGLFTIPTKTLGRSHRFKSNLISELLFTGSVDLDEGDTPVLQLDGGLLDFWNRETVQNVFYRLASLVKFLGQFLKTEQLMNSNKQ